MISVYLGYFSIDVIGHHDQGNFLEDNYLELKALEKHDEVNRAEGAPATGAVAENGARGQQREQTGVGEHTGNCVMF